jgi:phosphoglycolate phosphatase
LQDIDLIVFDWDGTIWDSTAVIADSIQKAAADLKLPVPSRQRARFVIGMGLQDALRYAIPELPKEQIPDIVTRYRHHFLGRENDISLFDGMRELLTDLRTQGRRCAIATGKNRIGLERALEQAQLRPFFETSRCADEGFPKPHPWMLDDLMRETEVPTHRMVMIGDTTHDLELAFNAGAQFIGVTYGAHEADALRQPGVAGVADSVQQLRELLKVADRA